MFTVYALDMHDGPEFDQEVQCATLDEALTHLRELITSEMEDIFQGEGARFERYGLSFDPANSVQ